MLVRFLSFAASVIGTRRYRPILLSLVAVILSVASITAVASVLRGQPHPAASTAGQQSPEASQQTTSELGFDKKATRDEPVASTSTPQTQAPVAGDNSKPLSGNSNSQNSATTPEITFAVSNPVLSPANPTVTVHASTSDKSSVTWSVITENSGINDVSVSLEQSSAGSVVGLRFKLEQNAKPGTYQFNVSAKDDAHGLELSKKITITVNG